MSPVGMVEERRMSAMYAVGDAHLFKFLVGMEGGEEDLNHICSGRCSVTHVPSGGRRGGFVPCTH